MYTAYKASARNLQAFRMKSDIFLFFPDTYAAVYILYLYRDDIIIIRNEMFLVLWVILSFSLSLSILQVFTRKIMNYYYWIIDIIIIIIIVYSVGKVLSN